MTVEQIKKEAKEITKDFKDRGLAKKVRDAFECGALFVLENKVAPTMREMRLQLKLTLKNVEDATGVCYAYVAHIEKKAHEKASGETYMKVYNYLSNLIKKQK